MANANFLQACSRSMLIFVPCVTLLAQNVEKKETKEYHFPSVVDFYAGHLQRAYPGQPWELTDDQSRELREGFRQAQKGFDERFQASYAEAMTKLEEAESKSDPADSKKQVRLSREDYARIREECSVEHRKEVKKLVNDVLLEKQREQLDQYIFQAGGLRAILVLEVQAKLEMTDEQVDDLKQAVIRLGEARPVASPAVRKAYSDARTKILDELIAELKLPKERELAFVELFSEHPEKMNEFNQRIEQEAVKNIPASERAKKPETYDEKLEKLIREILSKSQFEKLQKLVEKVDSAKE